MNLQLVISTWDNSGQVPNPGDQVFSKPGHCKDSRKWTGIPGRALVSAENWTAAQGLRWKTGDGVGTWPGEGSPTLPHSDSFQIPEATSFSVYILLMN